MAVATESPPEEAVAAEAEPEAADPNAAPPPSPAGPSSVLVGIGLNEETMQRVRDAGSFDVSTDFSHIPRAHVVAISTRSDRGQTPSIPEDVNPAEDTVVVICHPGGEETAIALMQQGCEGVIAEGNEGALSAFVDPETHTDVLVEGFLESQERGGAGNGRYRDPVTNLPETASFELRLSELIEAGPPPNLLLLQISNLEDARLRTDTRAINLVRRRLASFFSDAARRCECEIFSLSDATFAILDGARCINDAEALAEELIQITEAFRPAGLTLHLAVGAASASEESEAATVQEQAEHAVMAASRGDESAFATADQVALLLASVTEYNVAQLLVSMVDQKLPNPEGHSTRVADLACDIGRELGLGDADLSNLRLAALLHEVGRIPLGDSDDQVGDDYPERGARYVAASAGPEIADAIRHQGEHWDGEGPNGLDEITIPLDARIIAIADAADNWLHPADPAEAMVPAALVDKLEEGSRTRFDPDLVRIAQRLFGA
ncbi:MAG: HD domain-containing protein [bacterium]|nr:HD domain-containing protein [bacterium]